MEQSCMKDVWRSKHVFPTRTETIPAGTQNRKELQRRIDYISGHNQAVQAWRDGLAAAELACPHCAARRADMAEWRKRDADRRAAREAELPAIRRAVLKHLRRLDFRREFTSGHSAYYYSLNRPEFVVRISDHEVPQSDERDHNRAVGRGSWADTWRSLVIDWRLSWCDCARWIIEVKRHA